MSYTTGEEEGQWSYHRTLQVTDSGSQPKASSGENLRQNNRPQNRVKAVPWQSAPNRWHPLTPPPTCPSPNLVTSLPFQFLSQSEPLLCLSPALTQPQLPMASSPCSLQDLTHRPAHKPQVLRLARSPAQSPDPLPLHVSRAGPEGWDRGEIQGVQQPQRR